MDIIELQAEPRELRGRDTNELREQDLVPAVVYGSKTKSTSVQVDRNSFDRALEQAGRSSLVDLKIGDTAPIKVIIQDVDLDPLRDDVRHVDFYAVDLTKIVSATVSLNFIGVSSAVKELGGTLLKARTTVELKGLPDKLVPSIDIDISKLDTFEDVIHVKDLELPEGLEFDIDPERTIAVVNPPRTEEQLKELDEVPTEGEVPEGAEEDKPEGEEGAEGAEGEAKPEEGSKEPKKEDAKK